LVAAGLRQAWNATPLFLPSHPAGAIQAAQSLARAQDGVVVVTGSLYLVGEIRAQLTPMAQDPELPDF
jgi:folylpolyglutamate synthase/dihydropteroate synthase